MSLSSSSALHSTLITPETPDWSTKTPLWAWALTTSTLVTFPTIHPSPQWLQADFQVATPKLQTPPIWKGTVSYPFPSQKNPVQTYIPPTAQARPEGFPREGSNPPRSKTLVWNSDSSPFLYLTLVWIIRHCSKSWPKIHKHSKSGEHY